MRALETIHSALRPHGLLLDVRPALQYPTVQITRRGAHPDQPERVTSLGRVDDSYRHDTLRMADAAIRQVIEARLFERERAETFTFVYHFDSVETWLAYMAEHWRTGALSSALIARARREQAREQGEIRVLRAVNATRLRRT